MSGTASRYIGGVPYSPGMGVGRYPSTGSLLSAPGVRPGYGGGALLPVVDGSGIAVNPSAGAVRPMEGGDMGGNNLLLAAALGLLGYAPDIYSGVRNLVSGEPAAATSTRQPVSDPTPLSDGLGGVPLPRIAGAPPEVVAAQELAHSEGLGFPVTPVGLQPPPGVPLDAFRAQELMQSGGFDGFGASPMNYTPTPDGFGALGAQPGEFASVRAPADMAQPAAPGGSDTGFLAGFNNPLGLPTEFMATEPGALGTLGGYDVLGSAAYVPAAIIGYGARTLAKPGGEMGAQIGAGLGGIVGGIIGGPWGAAAGALGGGAIGGQIGPNPTIGRNFSGTGTFGGDGNIYFGGFGGDNGGDATGAQAFANQFGQNLLAQAAAQGLSFNPNMAGVQFNIGGFDNFSRRGVTPGGFFYDPMRGGSPENYALRPNGGEAYSPQQAQQFTEAVLADMTARGVFTQPGQAQPGMDFYGSTLGADLGGYGYAPGWSGGNFQSILGDRQMAIQGYLNDQQARAAGAAQAQAMLGAGYDQFADYRGVDWDAWQNAYGAPAGQAGAVAPVSWADSA